MFGQPHNSSPFATPGNNTITPFASSPATPAFGSPATATGGLFGGSTTASSSTGFGMTSGQTNGFGSFGSPTATSTSSGFGGFASPTPAPTFGASASSAPTLPFAHSAQTNNGGRFGSATTTPANSGGLFSNGNTAAGAFGPTSTTSGFGGLGSNQPATTGFGSSQVTQASTFGVPSPSTGIFGSSTLKVSGFGSTTTPAFGSPAPGSTGLFANTTTTPAPTTGCLFGSSSPNTSKLTGTCAHPYQVTTTLDGNSQIHIQAITGMAVYENRSLEELRYEDYLSGNRGSMGQKQQQTAGAFGNSPVSPALSNGFGLSNTNSMFASAPSSSGLGLFGSPAPAFSNTSFGTPSVPPVFGASSTVPTNSTNTFGQVTNSNNGGLFGLTPATSSNSANGESSFGSVTTTKSTATSGSLFGSINAPANRDLFTCAKSVSTSGNSSSLFGPTHAPTTGVQFGSLFAPSINNPLSGSGSTSAPVMGGLFGSVSTPAASNKLFGSSTPGFGIASASSSGELFGTPAAIGLGTSGTSSQGVVGTSIQPTSVAGSGFLFGSNNQSKLSTGGLFSSGTPAPFVGGSFNNTSAPCFPTSTTNFTPSCDTSFGFSQPTPKFAPLLIAPMSLDAMLAQQLAAVEKQKKNLTLLDSWRTSPDSLTPNVTPSSFFEKNSCGKKYLKTYTSSLSACYISSVNRSTAKIRPRGFSKILTTNNGDIPGKLSTGVTDSMGIFLSANSNLSMSTKNLVIKPGVLSLKPKMKLVFKGESDVHGINNQVRGNDDGEKKNNKILSFNHNEDVSIPDLKCLATKTRSSLVMSPSHHTTTSTSHLSPVPTSSEHSTYLKKSSSEKKKSTYINKNSHEFYKQVVGHSLNVEGLVLKSTTTLRKNDESYPIVPKLTKEGYTVVPTIEELTSMSESNLAVVSGFSVSRSGYGSIAWDGAVDVRYVDLDMSISIEDKDVAVYDVEERNGTKPCIGSKLNRSAVVTLFNVFPQDGGRNATVETKEKFKRKIFKSSKKMGTEHLMYDVDSGVWKFRVKHFSRFNFVRGRLGTIPSPVKQETINTDRTI